MPDQLPGDDAKSIWQNQSTELSMLTSKLIQAKARALQSKTRKKLIGTVAGPLTAVMLYAFGIIEFSPLGHLLHPLFAGALLWSLAGFYFLNRGMWSVVMPGDSGLSTGLEFCRGEIERQRNLLRRVLLWSLGPVLMALATFILGLAMIGTKHMRLFPNGLPFLALVVAWMFGYVIMRGRELRELKHEIDELNNLENENQR